ncbi:hypothetical protein N0V88_006337 [Collariella sp. IMI 366227]|nr:hypothetical protein N0V88_006337 [Collariella sp. IMI 366227]
MEAPTPPYGIVSFTTSNQDDNEQWFYLEIQRHTTVFEIWRLSPAPPAPKDGQLTLSHFLPNAFFKCNLTAVYEVLAHQDLKSLEMGEDLWPPGHPDREEPWTTSFPSFRPAEVLVICDNPEQPFDPAFRPKNVRIGQQLLVFKEAMDRDDNITKEEVETYERIESAGFGPSVRVSRLYGVVRNERNQLVGVLLYPIEKETSLRFAVGSKTTDAQKNRWAQQIQGTLAALHRIGIVWGASHPYNVLIDVHGDAWVTNFVGGRIEWWVDADKEGTVDGDLQGLGRILAFIKAGGDGLMESLEE